jgi:hypothetical protein
VTRPERHRQGTSVPLERSEDELFYHPGIPLPHEASERDSLVVRALVLALAIIADGKNVSDLESREEVNFTLTPELLRQADQFNLSTHETSYGIRLRAYR